MVTQKRGNWALRRIEVESHNEIPEMRSRVLSQGNAPRTHASDRPFGRSAYRPVCSMHPKTTEAPIWGLPDVAQVIALENGAIHYNPVTSMKSV